MWQYTDDLDDLSMLRTGEIVLAFSMIAIVPKSPLFGRSFGSSEISISSAETSGVASSTV